MFIYNVYGGTVFLDLPETALPMLRRWKERYPERKLVVSFGHWEFELRLDELVFPDEEKAGEDVSA